MEKNFNPSENDPQFGLPENQNPGKRNVFSTPADYFEKLPLEVSDKIHSGKTSDSVFRLFSINFTVPKLVGISAVIVVVVAGSLIFKNNNDNKRIHETTLSFDDIVNTEYVAEIDESILFDAYSSTTIPIDSAAHSTDAEITDLQEYLIENNTDLALIINEL
ncbi:MAG TPA: hypothetical protein PKD91_09585 [Bacteroidia bacterium]|nr:hypothetical protein [Bacteroidia bacterium]